ncbi:MAG: cyclase family protein [Betaproteobacteria bacterium]|nr:cyclase family protein [Betaproteobacteria bacterium]
MKSNRVLAPVAAAVAMILTSGWAAAVEPEQVPSRAAKRIPRRRGPQATSRAWPTRSALAPGCAALCIRNPRRARTSFSYLRSNTMPKSPFSGPYNQKYKPTGGIPFSAHAFNGEELEAGAEPAAQATQMDAIGHFAFLPEPWKMQPPFPSDTATYYGGFKQSEVKPTPDSPLLKLGIEKAPPLITSAILLDAKTHVGGGKPLEAGRGVTAKDIEDMLAVQGLSGRGILPGDVVYIRTGWGDNWQDPDVDKVYYSKAPGLAYDAAKYLGDKRIVAIGLDTPFIDPVPEGMMQARPRPPKAPARPAPSPSTTTCSPRWASTTSNTPTSRPSPTTRCGRPAR